MDTERQFRLSVWRPARLTSVFDYPVDGSNSASFVFEADRLQEQIYVWDPGENDIFSALDKDLAEQFHMKLFGNFPPDLDPGKRSIDQFAKVIDELILTLRKSKPNRWAPSTEKVSQGQADDENLRVDVPLALLNHLLWLIRVFAHVPGASVTIR